MLYICRQCHIAFEHDTMPDRCPDCGKLSVFVANETERADYSNGESTVVLSGNTLIFTAKSRRRNSSS